MIKMVDTAVPMNEEGYPVARAKHIWLDDDTNLQKAIDDGVIGGGGSNAQTITQSEYDALDEQVKLEGEFYCYNSGRHFRNGVEYGKDGVQISDNETVEDKTWSSKKTSDEIAKVKTELNAKVGELSELKTTEKSNLVGAINEVVESGGGSVPLTEITTFTSAVNSGSVKYYVSNGIFRMFGRIRISRTEPSESTILFKLPSIITSENGLGLCKMTAMSLSFITRVDYNRDVSIPYVVELTTGERVSVTNQWVDIDFMTVL